MSEIEVIDGHAMIAGFGITPVDQIRDLTGREYLQGIIDGKFKAPTIGRTLQFRLSEVGEGFTVFTGVPSEEFMNPIGTVHGGYAATLLDSALACAVHSICPVGHASTSVELKVNFVRPILPDTGRLTCTGKVIHPGRQLATAEARLVDQAGKLYAHGTQTCSIFKLPV